MSAGADHRAILLYDRECGFCRWSLRRVLAWDRRRRLRAVPLQGHEAARLLSELDEQQRMASWHLIDAEGRRSSAGAALAPLLRELPGGAPLAGLADAAPGAVEGGYAMIVRHRSALGRLVRMLGAR